MFGAAVVGQSLASFHLDIVLYAVLSLTVIRMLPVFFCLAGTTARTESRLFIGWFGPRGLASIVFAVIVLDAGLPQAQTLAQVVVWPVMLSILAHGVSANLWANSFGERSRRAAGT